METVPFSHGSNDENNMANPTATATWLAEHDNGGKSC